jgi:hypothetical protein
MIDRSSSVNGNAYMDFKKITDSLLERVTHEDLAQTLGASVASIRQARLDPSANAHRSPPEGWEAAVLRLAERQLRHYQRLVDRLRRAEKA